jgi:hypothetical protein
MRYLAFRDPLDVLAATQTLSASPALTRILHMVQGMEADTLGVEEDFDSAHWKAEYDAVYGKAFRPISDKAVRLHFFRFGAAAPGDERLKHLAPGDYMGYCILRPGGHRASVLEAIVPPCRAVSARKHYFPLCCFPKKVVIPAPKGSGNELTVEGFPFHQQDGWCLTCAEIAILSVMEYLSAKSMARMPTVQEIIDRTRNVVGISREAKSLGLQLPDVVRCFRELDVISTFLYWQVNEAKPLPPETAIYPYLESGLPIIVSIPTVGSRHALILLGHTFGQDYWWLNAGPGYYRQRPEQEGIPWVLNEVMVYPSALWLRDYIVNDDNFGPYLTIPKEFMLGSAAAQEHEPRHLGIVTLLPKGVRLPAEGIDRLARHWLSWQIETIFPSRTAVPGEQALSGEGLEWFARLVDCIYRGHQVVEENRVILRTLLIRGSEYKTHLAHDCQDQQTQALISGLRLPEFMWMTEVSLPNLFCLQRKKLGELLFDASEPRETGRFPGLMAVLCGSIFGMEPAVGQLPANQGIAIRPCRDILRGMTDE